MLQTQPKPVPGTPVLYASAWDCFVKIFRHEVRWWSLQWLRVQCTRGGASLVPRVYRASTRACYLRCWVLLQLTPSSSWATGSERRSSRPIPLMYWRRWAPLGNVHCQVNPVDPVSHIACSKSAWQEHCQVCLLPLLPFQLKGWSVSCRWVFQEYPRISECTQCGTVHCRCKGQQGPLRDTPIQWCVVCSCTGVEGCLLCTEGWSSLGLEVCFWLGKVRVVGVSVQTILKHSLMNNCTPCQHHSLIIYTHCAPPFIVYMRHEIFHTTGHMWTVHSLFEHIYLHTPQHAYLYTPLNTHSLYTSTHTVCTPRHTQLYKFRAPTQWCVNLFLSLLDIPGMGIYFASYEAFIRWIIQDGRRYTAYSVFY